MTDSQHRAASETSLLLNKVIACEFRLNWAGTLGSSHSHPKVSVFEVPNGNVLTMVSPGFLTKVRRYHNFRLITFRTDWGLSVRWTIGLPRYARSRLDERNLGSPEFFNQRERFRGVASGQESSPPAPRAVIFRMPVQV